MPAPTQLLLGIAPPHAPGFDNFVVGANAEAVERVRDLAQSRTAATVYLWGAPGAGKSHLLAAVARLAAPRRPVVVLSATGDCDLAALEQRGGGLVIADDIDRLDDSHQQLLFRLFNSARATATSLLLAGPDAPLQLGLREDLRTRVGQCLVLQLTTLSEADRRGALQRHAAQRGMRLDDTLVDYLLRHGRRDLPSLMTALDRLDRASLEQKRLPTLPLLRDILQQHLTLDPPA